MRPRFQAFAEEFLKTAAGAISANADVPLVKLVKKERVVAPVTGSNDEGKLEYLRLKEKGQIPKEDQSPEPGFAPDFEVTKHAWAKIAESTVKKEAAQQKTAAGLAQQKLNIKSAQNVGAFKGRTDRTKMYGRGLTYNQQTPTFGRGQQKTMATTKGIFG